MADLESLADGVPVAANGGISQAARAAGRPKALRCLAGRSHGTGLSGPRILRPAVRWRVLAAVLAAAACLPGCTAAARAAACPEVGATYVARPTVLAHPDPRSPPPAYSYRLRIGLLPQGALGSAVSELWRFQALALHGGTLVSELRMLRVCGVGRSPCLVAPPSRPNPDDGYASEEVALDRDLSVDVRDGAPYAIVLPGLAQADWSPDLVREVLAADLRFFTPAHVPPDLGLQELWVRTRCGR